MQREYGRTSRTTTFGEPNKRCVQRSHLLFFCVTSMSVLCFRLTPQNTTETTITMLMTTTAIWEEQQLDVNNVNTCKVACEIGNSTDTHAGRSTSARSIYSDNRSREIPPAQGKTHESAHMRIMFSPFRVLMTKARERSRLLASSGTTCSRCCKSLIPSSDRGRAPSAKRR